MDTNDITFSVTVHLNGKQLANDFAAQSPSRFEENVVGGATALEVARPRSYYQGYEGYTKDFLDIPVELPTLTEEQRRNAAKNSDTKSINDPTILPYTHFSIVMNRRRQLAYYTAVNIDGSQSQELSRGKDRWFFDSRIAESEQIGEALYSRNALDRGHLVRRLDPVWGPQAQRANDDTFHFTNCSPQHARFNQGQDLWQGLENYLLHTADIKNKRITVFTGPVMQEDDPLYKGVRLPLAFWKILVYVKGENLAAAAYMLEQEQLIEDMLGREAAFEAGTFRVELNEIKTRTGLDFDYLKAHELPLSANGLELVAKRFRIRMDYKNLSM
ncbi:DNA/RNA non-specific endonuclease [Hymenobacter swuensis]|nr:DNA/RNA non-specific endonuclease [Hymenobacter swuensis]